MGQALEPVSVDRCPDCSAPAADLTYTEAALFRGGGYGADRHTIIRYCARFCGWWIRRHVGEQRPPRVAA